MEFSSDEVKIVDIFQPGMFGTMAEVAEGNLRFVYYTSADTAMKVLNNSELWFRNATAMNDFSEIQYGLDLILSVFDGDEGKRFREAIEGIVPGTMERVDELFFGWQSDWKLETYIACVSLHHSEEDERGRLSMWRAYGDVALVVKNTPMMAVTDNLAVYSVPVQYLEERDLAQQISKVIDNVLAEKAFLEGLGQESLVGCIHQMLFRFAIATKHPGFAEEKEWRLYYRPTERESPGMSEEIVVLGGVPQKVFKLRLADEPENGLHKADIPNLLDRIIIGPTEYPYVSYIAFSDVLKKLGVVDADEKVILSDIPLRVGS